MEKQITSDKLVNIGEEAGYAVVYSPTKGLAFRVERVKAGKISQSEVLNAHSVKIGGELSLDEKKSNQLALFLTTSCNADCIYCYAKSELKPIRMSFETAKKGITFVAKKNEPLDLLFFGGGEPTLEFELMKKSKNYAERLCKKISLHIQSNGVFSEQVLDWLIENKANVTISCDGPPEIQDMQRPLKGGNKSSSIVEKTIKGFVEKYDAKKIGIRATITKYSVNRLMEIIEYFDRLGVKKIALDPFIKSAESQRNNLQEVKPKSFSENFLKALEFSEQIGVRLSSSFLSLNRRPYICGFSLPQFCLTPDGFVTSCLETISSNIGPQEFIYGRLTGNKFEFDHEKIETMKRRRVENMEKCRDCFLKHTCAGGCASEFLKKTGDIFTPPQEKCDFLKKNLKEYVSFKVKKELDNCYPALKNENNKKYLSMHFSEFELKECKPIEPLGKHPLINISLSNTDLQKLTKSILEYREKSEFKPVFFVLNFGIIEKDLNQDKGKIAWGFLKKLRNEKVRFFVSKNFFPCMFGPDYEDFLQEFDFLEIESGIKHKGRDTPRGCVECVYFLRKKCGGFT